MNYSIPVGQAIACESKQTLFKDPSNEPSTQWNTLNFVNTKDDVLNNKEELLQKEKEETSVRRMTVSSSFTLGVLVTLLAVLVWKDYFSFFLALSVPILGEAIVLFCCIHVTKNLKRIIMGILSTMSVLVLINCIYHIQDITTKIVFSNFINVFIDCGVLIMSVCDYWSI